MANGMLRNVWSLKTELQVLTVESPCQSCRGLSYDPSTWCGQWYCQGEAAVFTYMGKHDDNESNIENRNKDQETRTQGKMIREKTNKASETGGATITFSTYM